LPTSDSLRGTTSCIELRSLRTANGELEEAAEPEEPEPLERALEEDPPAAEPELDSPEELAAVLALVVPPPETVSPT
jgi:hypothetical protein